MSSVPIKGQPQTQVQCGSSGELSGAEVEQGIPGECSGARSGTVHMGSSLHHLPAFPYDRLHVEGLKTSGRPQPCWAGSLPSSEGKGCLCGRCSLTHSDEQEKCGPLTGGIDALPMGCYDAWSQEKALPLSWCPGGRAAGEGPSSAWMTLSDPRPLLSPGTAPSHSFTFELLGQPLVRISLP